MNRALRLHPDSHCKAVSRIDVAVRRLQPTHLALRYVLIGKIGEIAWPARSPATRTDELWLHCCFEVFVQRAPDAGYCEFNFSPSTQWAAYAFDGYRSGMRPLEMAAPTISTDFDGDQFALTAEFELPKSFVAPLRLALCAVIEALDGTLSYWALNHPTGKPDFHHADGYTLTL